MGGRICVYCGVGTKLTLEEVFPNFLTKLHHQYSTFLGRKRRPLVTRKSPQLRDVCDVCNNQRLSALDAAASTLCKQYLRKFVPPGGHGVMQYDYHVLCRWLWKVLYNSCRSEGELRDPFQPLLKYILGLTSRPPQPQTLFVGVIRADWATTAERAQLRSRFLYPRGVRLGTTSLGSLHQLADFGVFMGINSYLFTLIRWRHRIDRKIRRDAARDLAEREDTTILSEAARPVEIPESNLSVRKYLAHGTWSDRLLYMG